MIRIKFPTDKDRINGYYELATKGQVRGFRNGVYEISDEDLKILDNAGIVYHILTQEEILDVYKTLRDTVTIGI